MRRAARRDKNHQYIVKCYRDLGCYVADTANLGLGLPDLFVGTAGVTDPVEIKSEGGTLTPLQQVFIRDWRGSPVQVVFSQTDVIVHVGNMRKRARQQ